MNVYPERYVIVNGEPREFESVKAGEEFELYESNGELVGKYIADGDAFLNNQIIWSINIRSKVK